VRIPPKTKSVPPASALAPAPPTVPPHRPSFEIDTPLPRPVPYHIADPTSSQMKLAREEAERESQHESIDDVIETRPGEQKRTRLKPETDTTGLAQAARRISISRPSSTRGSARGCLPKTWRRSSNHRRRCRPSRSCSTTSCRPRCPEPAGRTGRARIDRRRVRVLRTRRSARARPVQRTDRRSATRRWIRRPICTRRCPCATRGSM